MKKYQIYGVGAALVDTEVVVTNEFLSTHKIDKGIMTLVDEERQFELLAALDSHHVKRSCGGSACNTIVAASCFGPDGLYSSKFANVASASVVSQFGQRINLVEYEQLKHQFGI